MNENPLLTSNKEVISHQKSEEDVIKFARRDWRHWPFHWDTMPQQKGNESFSLNSKEKWSTFVGSILVPASLWATQAIENYFISNASMIDRVLGKEVPLPVQLVLPVAILGSVYIFVSGPFSALRRLREQRLINWWKSNK